MIDHKYYIDEFSNTHELAKELDKGGQGIVYRTNDPNLVIKVAINAQGEIISDPDLVRKYEEKLLRVRLLPLPQGVRIATPLALLDQYAGYVMSLLADMVPFSTLWLDQETAKNMQRDQMPKWLVGEGDRMIDDKQLLDLKRIAHYAQTGGLRRRLLALHSCAEIIAQLHGNALVYGDISPNNIFLSADVQRSEVWLIDADNLAFDRADSIIVYTPKYGAPELVQGQSGVGPASDCYAFAVMAFYLLSTVHPFIGKKVLGGANDEADWADSAASDPEGGDLDEQAYAGRLPWIHDQHDESNKAMGGLPVALILTSALKTLFQRTFGVGRLQPTQRPAIYHWVDALAQAADRTIACHECLMSWDADLNVATCPYCKSAKPAVLCLNAYDWHDGKLDEQPCWQYMHELHLNTPILIPKRLTHAAMSKSMGVYELQMVMEDAQHVILQKNEFSECGLAIAVPDVAQGAFQNMAHQMRIEINSNQTIAFWLSVAGDYPRIIQATIRGAVTCG